MNNKKLCLIFAMAALLVLSALQASAFTYFVEPLNNTITGYETASFELTIRNAADYDDFVTVSTRDVKWTVSTDPQIGLVEAGKDKTVILNLKPNPLISEGRTYFIPVKIKSEKTGFHFEEREKFAVYVVSPNLKPGEFEFTVTPLIYMDNVIDPKEKVSVRLNLRNRNGKNIEEMRVVVDGEVFHKEYTTPLMPLEEKSNEILFEIDPVTPPGKRTATVTLYYDGEPRSQSSTEYEILGYEELDKERVSQSFLFRTETTITITNNGNQEAVAEQSFRMNFFKRLFTSFEPSAAKEKIDGRTAYVIENELAPQESLEIRVITNYRALVIIILLIIIAIVLYYVLRSPIIMVKGAEPLGKTKEGVNEIKVRIFIKNRSRKAISNVRVVDTIPSIAEIEKKASLGSMEPINIGKSRKGTIVRWELDVLEPYEERIITYKVKSKLKLVGGIRLPSAKARFETPKGKERVSFSKTINLVYRH